LVLPSGGWQSLIQPSMFSVSRESVIILIACMPIVIMLIVCIPIVIILIVCMPIVIILRAIMLSVFMLSVSFMLSNIFQSVTVLNVKQILGVVLLIFIRITGKMLSVFREGIIILRDII